eukprot:6896574-Pyramimonas_sp.AAC.1
MSAWLSGGAGSERQGPRGWHSQAWHSQRGPPRDTQRSWHSQDWHSQQGRELDYAIIVWADRRARQRAARQRAEPYIFPSGPR